MARFYTFLNYRTDLPVVVNLDQISHVRAGNPTPALPKSKEAATALFVTVGNGTELEVWPIPEFANEDVSQWGPEEALTNFTRAMHKLN